MGAVSSVWCLQVFVPGHAAVVQHSPRPGADVLEVPAGEVSVVQTPAGKIVAVDPPIDPVRLHGKLPRLIHLHPATAINNVTNRHAIPGDRHVRRRDAGAGCEPVVGGEDSTAHSRLRSDHLAPAHSHFVQQTATVKTQAQHEVAPRVSHGYHLAGRILNYRAGGGASARAGTVGSPRLWLGSSNVGFSHQRHWPEQPGL